MPTKRAAKAAAPMVTSDMDADEQCDIIYNLLPAAKRQKKEDPYDTSLQEAAAKKLAKANDCLLYTSPSPRD